MLTLPIQSKEDYKNQNVQFGATCKDTFVHVCLEAEEAESIYLHVDSQRIELMMTAPNIWEAFCDGDYHNKEYLYEVVRNGESIFSIDPWAVSTNTNSQKGVFINLDKINKSIKGDSSKNNQFVTVPAPILYETHIRDFTVNEHFRSEKVGTYNRFGDKNSTGMKHLKELGVTHIHLLPVFDFTSVDDTNVKETYNWGYDPFLFNSPEGSYSSDSSSGEVRVRELRQMIQNLHDEGFKVIMDVVYNHTSHERHNPLHVFYPNSAYRKYGNGEWGNGSGCGNELNTEHPSIRKFIVDSLSYWQQYYQVDGFRFDLMALYDAETMYTIENTLRDFDEDVLLYGEPWTGGVSALALEKQFLKGKQWDTKIGLFNDEFRNAIKGDNDGIEKGLIASNEYHQMGVLRGLFGSIEYNDWIKGFAKDPLQSINYVSAHDNLCLYDKIEKSCPEFFYQDRIRLNKFALSVLLTSQGIPFISQATEILHHKKGEHNSYNMGDIVNQVNWEMNKDKEDVFAFTRDLIRLRKDQTALHLESANDVREFVKFTHNQHGLLGYTCHGKNEEDYKEILVLHNFNSFNLNVDIEGEWLVLAHDGKIDLEGLELSQHSIHVPYLSTAILVKL